MGRSRRGARQHWLALALALAVAASRVAATPVSVSTWASLQAAVAAAPAGSPTTIQVTAHLRSTGTPALVPAGAHVTVAGASGGCGTSPFPFPGVGTLCTLDSLAQSQHFSVGANAALTLSSVALVNGVTATDNGGAVTAPSVGANVTLTLVGAMLLNNTCSKGLGGAVYMDSGAFTAQGSVLSNNSASGTNSYGGAFSCTSECLQPSCCVVTLTNSTLSNNYAYVAGGAINNFGPAVVQSYSQLVGNVATTYGGGAINNVGSVLIADSFMRDNSSPAGWGGAMDANGNVTVVRSVFDGNNCPAGIGGAVYMGPGNDNPAPTLVITNCTVSNSAAQSGAFYADKTVFTAVTGTAWINNSASINGAGLFSADTAVVITSSTFVGNTAPSGIGGGVYLGGDATHSITNTVFDSNSAYQSAGAVFTAGGNIFVTDSVFVNNNVAGLFSRAGAVSIEAQSDGAALFSNVTFVSNQAYTPVLSADFLVSSFSVGYAQADVDSGFTLTADATFGQGKGGAVFVANSLLGNPGAGLLSLNFSGCTFSGNNAMYGGAVALPGSGPVAVTFSSTTFDSNSASGSGGALYVGTATSVALTGCTLTGNTATADGGAMHVHGGSAATVASGTVLRGNVARGRGGAVAVADTASVSLAGGAVSLNRAFGGGAFYIANGPAGAAPSLVVSAPVSSNFAQAGGAWLLDVATATPPSCTPVGCALNNTAWLGPTYSTLPAGINVSVPKSVRSSDGLPASLQLFDGFNQVASSWDLLAKASGNDNSLSGALDASYGVGNATFPLLVLRGPETSKHSVTFTVSADSLGALNGASVTVNVSIQFCNISADGSTVLPQQLDPVSQRCICNPGTFTAVLADGSTTCAVCAPGSVAPDKGMPSCIACPMNQYSVNTTTCTQCPSTSVSSTGSSSLSNCTCGYGFFSWYSDNGSTFDCRECPDGALCPGPTIPLALDGFWRLPDDYTRFYECEADRCVAQTADVANEENCIEGHTGITCGVCKDGYSLQGMKCLPCKPQDAFNNWPKASRGGFVTGASIFCVTIATWFLLLPVTGGAMEDLPPKLRHFSTRYLPGSFTRRIHKSVKHDVPHSDPEPRGGADLNSAVGEAAPEEAIAHNGGAVSSPDAHNGHSGHSAGDGAHSAHGGSHGHAAEHAGMDSRLARALGVAKHCTVPGRMAIENLQIVGAFQDTVHVAWPRIFTHIMSRLHVFNFSFLELPAAACVNPNVPFFTKFNGVTLSVTGILGYMVAMWGVGRFIARLRGLPRERHISFNRTMLSRIILFLILCYAPLSETIIGVFGCTPIGDVFYMREDLKVQCYTPVYNSYYKAGIFWLILYPAGIPVFFYALLYYYRVPQTAARVKADASVRQLVDFAWQRRIPQPEVNTSALTYSSITPEHVDRLYEGVFESHHRGSGKHLETPTSSMEELPLDGAPENGEVTPPSTPAAEHPTASPSRREQLRAASVAHLQAGTVATSQPAPPEMWMTGPQQFLRRWFPYESSTELTRDQKLARLLKWVKSRVRGVHLSWHDVPRSDYEDAAEAVGVLFEEFYVSSFYWTLYEVLFKFVITCALSFVKPGTPAQIVTGVAITFCSLLYFQAVLPYVDKYVRRTAYTLQIVLVLFFMLGLLIKLDVVLLSQDTDQIYGGIAGVLVISIFAVPFLFVVMSPTVRSLLAGSHIH